jgi:hypothetical protein
VSYGGYLWVSIRVSTVISIMKPVRYDPKSGIYQLNSTQSHTWGHTGLYTRHNIPTISQPNLGIEPNTRTRPVSKLVWSLGLETRVNIWYLSILVVLFVSINRLFFLRIMNLFFCGWALRVRATSIMLWFLFASA